jgi:hypothetical protein
VHGIILAVVYFINERNFISIFIVNRLKDGLRQMKKIKLNMQHNSNQPNISLQHDTSNHRIFRPSERQGYFYQIFFIIHLILLSILLFILL